MEVVLAQTKSKAQKQRQVPSLKACYTAANANSISNFHHNLAGGRYCAPLTVQEPEAQGLR